MAKCSTCGTHIWEYEGCACDGDRAEETIAAHEAMIEAKIRAADDREMED
jgi:hypothetical protein